MVEKHEKKEETVEDNDLSAFNLGAKQLELIGHLMAEASKHYVDYNYQNCFFRLKSLKLQIISRLNKGQREELERLESNILRLLKLFSSSEQPDDKITHFLVTSIDKYDTRLKELLEICGFLVPTVSDSSNIFGQDAQRYNEG